MGENKEKLLCLLLENLHQEYSDNVCDVLYLITEEICKNENCELSDISLLSKGSYSSVFGIGHKVMKLSKDRASIDFPNNPYIVKPLLRRFLDENLFIEVTEKVNTNIKISNQELYNLYVELRDSGLVWTDVNKRNVGVLEKDNIIYWNYYLNPSDIALKFNDKIYGYPYKYPSSKLRIHAFVFFFVFKSIC